MRNLDSEWASSHPDEPPEERTIMWQGVALVRLPEVPIASFRMLEREGSDGLITPLVEAVSYGLELSSRQAFFDVLEANPSMPFRRVTQLWRAMTEAGSGRPTQPPDGLSPSPSANGTPSTDGRSTPEAWTSGGSVPGALPISHTPSS